MTRNNQRIFTSFKSYTILKSGSISFCRSYIPSYSVRNNCDSFPQQIGIIIIADLHFPSFGSSNCNYI